jgi:hypothetical protein
MLAVLIATIWAQPIALDDKWTGWISEAGVSGREHFNELLLETAGSLNMEAQELLESIQASADVVGAPDPVALLLQLRDELQLETNLVKEANSSKDVASSKTSGLPDQEADDENDEEIDAKTEEDNEETNREADVVNNAEFDEVQSALDSLDRILLQSLGSEATCMKKGLLDVRVTYACRGRILPIKIASEHAIVGFKNLSYQP